MLNEQLYKALTSAFGSVLVENEGVPAEIKRVFQSGFTTMWAFCEGADRGEQYRVNCPYCRSKKDGSKDTKHHLYVSYLSYSRPVLDGQEMAMGPLRALCFRADCLSSQDNRKDFELRLRYGISCTGNEQDGGFSLDMDKQRAAQSKQEVYTSTAVSLEGIRTWAPEFSWCTDGMPPEIENYLIGRGLDMTTLAQFCVGWGPVRTPRTGRQLNEGLPWVIVPIVMNGHLRGIQARCPDALLREGAIKYWIHPSMRKSTVVYNLDAARELNVAVVCEGVFDVFKVGAPGVCCFGHTPSPTQLSLLATINKGLIWLPDYSEDQAVDAVAKAYAIAADMNASTDFPLGVHVVRLPKKDAGEMERVDIWHTILDQVPDGMREYIVDRIIERL